MLTTVYAHSNPTLAAEKYEEYIRPIKARMAVSSPHMLKLGEGQAVKAMNGKLYMFTWLATTTGFIENRIEDLTGERPQFLERRGT
jgi:hypothetical protein